MEAVLNFNEPLNVELLDKVVQTFYQGHGAEQMNAQRVINQFQENPSAWQLVDGILENAKYFNTKYIALQILEKLVQSRWNSLPREQCEGIKNYIVSLVIKTSSVELSSKPEKIFLNKLNLLLVQILKHEWPKHWPTFISELVAASRTSLPLCENNMIILKLLSEEAFDFSADQMTTVRAKNLKTQLSGEFSEIFQLCIEILEYANRPTLIVATLEALLRFLKWIPLGYIFQTNLIETLRLRFLTDIKYRSVCLSCLTEVCALSVEAEYDIKFVQILQAVMDSLNIYFPLNNPTMADLNAIYQNERDDNPRFIQNSAIFLTTCLGNHFRALEQHGVPELMLIALQYLLNISAVDDREVFKVCLEYWNKFVGQLYREESFRTPSSVGGGSGLFLGDSGAAAGSSSRKARYSGILTSLRSLMIDKMVKPEEVLIVEDENGEVVREYTKDTDVLAIYAVMHETLVFLTHLDAEDTKRIMLTRLSMQFEEGGWNRSELNRICWAVGTISGAMNEEMEKSFVIQVIRDLLSLCEMKKGKDNKAVVASNIMYVVSRYPRFLRQHWKFLKTVVNKLFEFMHESHEGVQDMACDTFVTISERCHRQFVLQQAGESELFADEIIGRLEAIIGDLTPAQVHRFYEAMGHVLAAQTDLETQTREIANIMGAPNGTWSHTITALSSNPETLKSPETLKLLGTLLKTNIALCSSLGVPFLAQMSGIYMDMLSLYRLASRLVGESIKQQGTVATKTPLVRGLRTVKKDILRLMEVFVSKFESSNAGGMTSAQSGFVDAYIPLLFDAMLGDYRDNIREARDAEVLSLTAQIIDRFSGAMEDKVPPILDAVFECTLSMINRDFVEYPEHRVNFFRLLSAINSNCFAALLRLSPAHFKLIVDSVVWAFKHTHREIAESGLKICLELCKNFEERADASVAASFYHAFYISLLTDVFFVLTDAEHQSGFARQSALLAHLIGLLDNGRALGPSGGLGIQLNTPGNNNPTNTAASNNALIVRDYLAGILRNSFPQLQPAQQATFLQGLFDLYADMPTFKAHLRDFLISLKEFAADSEELFREERQLELERKDQAQRDAVAKIPGLKDDFEDEE